MLRFEPRGPRGREAGAPSNALSTAAGRISPVFGNGTSQAQCANVGRCSPKISNGRYTAIWKRATLFQQSSLWLTCDVGWQRSGLGDMDNWFASICTETQLSSEAAYALHTDGFIVLPGPVHGASLAELAHLYDEAVSGAAPDDVKVGSTTTPPIARRFGPA